MRWVTCKSFEAFLKDSCIWPVIFYFPMKKKMYFYPFIFHDKITPKNAFHCYIYFIKSAVNTRSVVMGPISVPLSIVNFSFTMLYHRQTTNECNSKYYEYFENMFTMHTCLSFISTSYFCIQFSTCDSTRNFFCNTHLEMQH